MAAADRLYLDHAATTPMLAEAKAAMIEGMDRWTNPSSPHAEGRAARAALEDARRRIGQALGWNGHIIFTSGASEAIAIGIGRAKVERVVTSPVEHDSVLRITPDAERLAVDAFGRVASLSIRPELVEGHSFSSDDKEGASTGSVRTGKRLLLAIQHVSNETGVIQPIDRIDRGTDILFADCAQSAGKLPLPQADMIAISGHKFGGAPGIGALLVRDLAMLNPSGGQEQGYRAGTENLPAVLAMAAALEHRADWLPRATLLRERLDSAIESAGGEVVAGDAPRIPTIASYRMPGVSARAQLIQFDLAGISVSAGSACSSGSLKSSHVLAAMGWDEEAAAEVVRVSFGPATDDTDVDRFLSAWLKMAERAR